MPKVSIIVPNYNHAKYLPQRLDSIFNQTYQDFEVILLDDCSTDDSVEILQKYARHPKVTHFIINRKNSGSTFKQWKRGIELAKGEYVWIAESDDEASLTFLEILLKPFFVYKDIVLSFCKSEWLDRQSEIGKDLSIYNESFVRRGIEEIREKLVLYNTIQNVSSVVFKAKELKKVSCDFVNYKSCGDWMLYIEILEKGSICFNQEVLNRFRWYHNNVSNNSAKEGLWIYEGVDVLRISKKILKFTIEERVKIVSYWIKRIKPLRRSIPFSLIKKTEIQLKIFWFAPIVYLKKLYYHE